MSDKKVSMSPVLKQILWGGSSISLDLMATHRRSQSKGRQFFDNNDLNKVIIFKHPNFTEGSDDDSMPWREHDDDVAAVTRPIETGIYAPTVRERPEIGGDAIYLRMKNYTELLAESFGVTDEVSRRDIDLLNVIDGTPSLDPFLLRSSIEERQISFNHELWSISEEENEQLRKIIAAKILPVIEVALCGGANNVWSSARVDDFLKAIWNPELPDAQQFVASFGFSQEEAKKVFNAWKGVTFYELQVRRTAPKAVELLKWLRSPQSVPIDIMANRMYEQQLSMFIAKTGSDLEAVLQDIRKVMSDYEGSLRAFKDGTPELFRDFLRTCQNKYWLLGYCTSALNAVALTFHQYRQRSSEGRLYYAQTYDMLRQMSVALDRRRERPSSL
jgi:hypothetical protein